MSRFYDALKSQALRRLPDRWLAALKARHYLRMVKNFNVDDEPDMKVLPLLVPMGTIAVDLGANVGVYTKLLSELVGSSGCVLSVEPVPETFALLRENVRGLGLGNVVVIDAAVSDAIGAATMRVPEYPSGGFNFYESQIVAVGTAASAATRERLVRVRTVTLDVLVEERSPVSFVKCDVEGHESRVITGSIALIRDQHPAWLIEISEDPDTTGTSAATLFDYLAASGYSPLFFDGTHLRNRRRGDRSTNYFFLTADHIERVRARAPRMLVANSC